MIGQLRAGFTKSSLVLGLVGLAYIVTVLVFGEHLAEDELTVGSIGFRFLHNSAFPLVCIALVALAAAPYFRKLVSQPRKFKFILLFFAIGVISAILINNPIHAFLINLAFELKIETAESQAATLPLFLLNLFATLIYMAIIVPIAEELVDRGMLFEELRSLPLLHIMLWSVFTFSFSHYLVFGITKVIAVLPIAFILTWIRYHYGSWIYAAAAHAGVNGYVTVAPLLGVEFG
jgi:membrane protease YdiL (CAAX protease family)